jgi:hypothetical protein
MVAMGLLTFIIVGLLLMFQQTQRAFRTSMTQTDVLESGRAIMELISREIEQASATRFPDTYQNGSTNRAINFFVDWPSFPTNLTQVLPGTVSPPQRRTNLVQRLFFMSRVNQDWVGTGYEVRFDDDPNGLVGTLCRYTMTNVDRVGIPMRRGPFIVSSGIFTNTPTRIAEGVVDFRIRTFDSGGFPIVGFGQGPNSAFVRTNEYFPPQGSATFPYAPIQDAFTISGPGAPDQMRGCYFYNRAIPAAVEIELGILEPRVAQRYKSIPITSAATDYLNSHAAQLHLFRQRIPIRNADLTVFP